MFKKISVLVPTRNRIERLRTLLESYARTTEGCVANSELVFRVDDDDVASKEFLEPLGHTVVVGPRLKGYGSMPEFFNELYRASSGDVLMSGNDDIIFRSAGWAPAILEEANKHPDGVFNIGPATLNELHYPYGITSRVAADARGFYWDPSIFWGDIYLRDIVAFFGRCVLLPNVLIQHDWAGNNPDQVFAESDKNITARDPTYWEGTHQRAVNSAIERMKTIYDQHLRASA